jgi:hypothetical protein
MRNVPEKICREKQNTFFYSIAFSENRAVYRVKWKNLVASENHRRK